MAKISVIIPVYNVENYLRECLDSVINQTFKDLEIICVNDGSTDSSPEILQEYAQKDSRIVIINKKNGGLSSARNVGIEHSQGEYTAFLDSDDWVDKDFYERLLNKCEKFNADVAVGLTLYWYSRERCETGHWVNQWVFKSNKEVIYLVEDRQNIIYSCACWNKLYKTDFIKKNNIKFPEGLLVEDVPFTFKTAILANKIVTDKCANIYYRQRRTSIINTIGQSEKVFDIFKIYDVVEQSLKEMPINKDLKFQYRNILNNFEIFNLFSYLNACNKEFKPKFYEKYRNKLKKINIQNNTFVTPKSKKIRQCCIRNKLVDKFYSDLNKEKPKILRKIFSITNERRNRQKRKVVTLLGIKAKFTVSQERKFNKTKLKQKIDNAEVISFDIFDTLLLRPYVKPTDLFLHIETNYKAEGFAQARIKAEQKARQLTFNDDITFDDIYNQIEPEYKKFKDIELKYEETLLFQNDEMFEMYNYAVQSGKRVIITSDMYLPETFIKKVLEKNGYTKYEHLYLSSEYKKTKSTGRLYDELLADCKCSPDKIIHIGDNMNSDYLQPKKYGIKSFYYEKVIVGFLAKDLKAQIFYEQNPDNLGASIILMQLALKNKFNNYWDKIGYKYGGPVCYGYTQWIAQQAKRDKIDNILFVARDGYTLKRIFELLDTGIPARYIYAPRFLSHICCLEVLTSTYDIPGLIIDYYKSRFNKQMKLDFENVNDYHDKYIFLTKYRQTFEIWAKEEKEKYYKYLKNSNENTNEKYAVVDTITEKFSSQRLIQSVMSDVTIKGYYWAILDNAETIGNKIIHSAYYPDYDWRSSMRCWNFMELLMTAPEYPIQTVIDEQPVYKKDITDEEIFRKAITNNISDFAVEFASDLICRFKDIPVALTYKEISSWVNILSDCPDSDDLQFMKQVKHAGDPEHTRYVELFPNWNGIREYNRKNTKLRRFVKTLGKIFYYKQKNHDHTIIRTRIFGIPIFKKKIQNFETKKYLFGIKYSTKLNVRDLIEAQKREIIDNMNWQINNLANNILADRENSDIEKDNELTADDLLEKYEQELMVRSK